MVRLSGLPACSPHLVRDEGNTSQHDWLCSRKEIAERKSWTSPYYDGVYRVICEYDVVVTSSTLF